MWHQLPTPCLESLCLKKKQQNKLPILFGRSGGEKHSPFSAQFPPFFHQNILPQAVTTLPLAREVDLPPL